MKGKVLFVAGLATGYVLGTRAGRKRYEQIKSGWEKIWNTEPVQKQVAKVEGFAKARVSEVPKVLASGAKKVVTTLASDATPGEKLDSTISAAKTTADELDDVSERGAASGDASSSTKRTK
ncbi:hypothetical protein [Paramicrobacterium agarici]|uniref:Uncharacterized protein n=1 Tax=Paramicrobacterium agarici TaxID=630514 RepID=A0A2A9DSD6_9MICO|nr:hypothetical protein [Microbacterium agarici]PFG29494.1 hypothetical protein ATJ78_0400 [Microbacterium agarici]TQO22499.1 hypothetical protein FB385_1330 [Microbacterium agarici]